MLWEVVFLVPATVDATADPHLGACTRFLCLAAAKLLPREGCLLVG